MKWLYTTLVLVSMTAAARAEAPTPVRTHGGLTVNEPPAARTEDPRGRVVPDVEGTLVANEPRVWVGPSVPGFVAVGYEDLELVGLEQHEDGYLARYRQMYGRPGVPGCAVESMWENCRQGARFYRKDGSLGWAVNFDALFPRQDHLSVNHLLRDGDVLYYGEACQTYSKDAKGKCGNLVALDVSGAMPKVLWRSKPLVTGAPILKLGRYLVTGYGFTAEKDMLHVVEAKTGRVVTSVKVKKAPEAMVVEGGNLSVLIYGSDEPLKFELRNFGDDAKGKPKLVLMK